MRFSKNQVIRIIKDIPIPTNTDDDHPSEWWSTNQGKFIYKSMELYKERILASVDQIEKGLTKNKVIQILDHAASIVQANGFKDPKTLSLPDGINEPKGLNNFWLTAFGTKLQDDFLGSILYSSVLIFHLKGFLDD